MKVSIDLLFIYMLIFSLFLFVLHEECVSWLPAASPISPSVSLALLQEPGSLLLERSTSRALSPGAQPAIAVAVQTWVSGLHLLSVLPLPPREELHHPPECLVSLLTGCTIRVLLHGYGRWAPGTGGKVQLSSLKPLVWQSRGWIFNAFYLSCIAFSCITESAAFNLYLDFPTRYEMSWWQNLQLLHIFKWCR